MARAIILARSQVTLVRDLPSQFAAMWELAGRARSELKEDMQGAAGLLRQTRANKKSVNREKLHAEFVRSCNTVATDMEARFCSPDHGVMAQGLLALNPSSPTVLEPQSVLIFAKLFGVVNDENLLTAQLLSAAAVLKQENPVLQLPIELGDFLMSFRGAFNLVVDCVAVALTVPVSSSSAERCFSAVKRIMTRLRSSMLDERLSDLTVLSQSTFAKHLDEDEIVSEFMAMRSRR